MPLSSSSLSLPIGFLFCAFILFTIILIYLSINKTFMRKLLLFVVLSYFINTKATAQNVAISGNGAVADQSAMLDIQSSSKGLLLPRMTQAQRDVIPGPATGLMIFQTDGAVGFYYNAGTSAAPSWTALGAAASAFSEWLTTGNGGTTTDNFIGTTDLKPLKFRAANVPSGILDYAKNNAALGSWALNSNTSGGYNAALGVSSLGFNTTGSENSALGYESLARNTTGMANTALGTHTFWSNITGSGNTALGAGAEVSASDLQNASAIGYRATVGCSNCLVLGSVSGVNNATSNVNVGIGTTAPKTPLSFGNNLGDKVSFFPAEGDHYGIGIQNNLLQIHSDMNQSDIAFGYGKSAAFNETMRIKGNGNVGIGTNNPISPLSFGATLGEKVSFWPGSGNNYGIGLQNNLMQLHTDVAGSDIAFGYGTSSAFNETMRIKGSGQLGIGTNPATRLDVHGGSWDLVNSEGDVRMGDPSYRLKFGVAITGTNAGSASIMQHGQPDGYNVLTLGAQNNYMMYLNGNTNRIGINTNQPDGKLEIKSNSNQTTPQMLLREEENDYTRFRMMNTAATFYWDIAGKPQATNATSVLNFYFSGSSDVLQLRGDGNATLMGVLTENSDARLKKDIHPISGALSKLVQLSGYTYFWKASNRDSTLQTGVLAQEVEKVLPELVKKDDKGILSVNYSGLIPVLIQSVKEQKEMIDSQADELKSLKEQVANLAKTLQALSAHQ
jgi:hypothetical protein